MADNLQKRPSKGILKNSSSFDKQDSRPSNSLARRKSKETKWDEMNIIATLHPPDKDYGHMKIDEPKTPYNYEQDDESTDVLDAAELAEKIRLGTDKLAKVLQQSESEDDDDDEDLTPEERAKRKEFESKRKKHYNEYYAVKLARKLLEEEEEDEDDDQDQKDLAKCGSCIEKPSNSSSSSSSKQTPDQISTTKIHNHSSEIDHDN